MKIKYCRSCNGKNLELLFSLGKMCFTGKFSSSYKNNIPSDILTLVICKKCKLVQLDRNFNPKYLYSKDYGYRTGINKTMTNHVKHVAKESVKIAKPKNEDYLLDIASNDGTLLMSYSKRFNLVGIDPLVNNKIKPNDVQRSLRAYEVKFFTKKSIFNWYKETKPIFKKSEFVKIYVDFPRSELIERINFRTKKMLESG